MKLIDTSPGSMRDAVAPVRRFDDTVPALRLDEAALNRLRELDPSGKTRLIERVFDAFEVSLQRMLPQLAAGMSGPPADADARIRGLRLIAHTLKSSATTVGASTMARQCGELEALLRDGRTDGVDSRIDALLTETVRVRLAMRMWTGHPA